MQRKDLMLAILVAIIWGSNYSITELGLKSIDPFLLTGLRFLLSAVPFCFFVRKPNVDIKYIGAYGIIFGVGLWGLANFALFTGLTAGVASLLLQFSAFFTVVLCAIFLQEKIKPYQYIGLSLSLLGLVLIIGCTIGQFRPISLVLILLSAFSWSICNIIIKKCKPDKVMSFIIWSGLFSAPPLFMIVLYNDGLRPFLDLPHLLTWKPIFSILFQAYITTLFGYYVWNVLMKKYAAVKIAPVSLLIPLSALVTSHYMFNEEITMQKLLAMFITMLGIYILVCDHTFIVRYMNKSNVDT